MTTLWVKRIREAIQQFDEGCITEGELFNYVYARLVDGQQDDPTLGAIDDPEQTADQA
jgi:hypothetical protein